MAAILSLGALYMLRVYRRDQGGRYNGFDDDRSRTTYAIRYSDDLQHERAVRGEAAVRGLHGRADSRMPSGEGSERGVCGYGHDAVRLSEARGRRLQFAR